jgi:hypothetical protein
MHKFLSKAKRFAPVGLALIVILGLVLALTPFESGATPQPLPPRPIPPPPRPSPPPPSGGDDDDKDERPVGAYIELHVPGAPAGVWAVVQWEDSASGWQDVEGWQGPLNADGRQQWWVEAKDFGSGPFRWAVVEGGDEQPLATSASFHLPRKAGETMRIEVSLGQ